MWKALIDAANAGLKAIWGRPSWTPDLLDQVEVPLSSWPKDDPAKFVNERLKRASQPTAAVVVAPNGETFPVNPAELTTSEQAQAAWKILNRLGYTEQIRTADTIMYLVHYPSEEHRRVHMIGPMNAARILGHYWRYPVEVADPITAKDISYARNEP